MTRPVLFLTGNLIDATTKTFSSGAVCTSFTLKCTEGCLTGDSIKCEAWGNKVADLAGLPAAHFTAELVLGHKLLISAWQPA
jgi:hypothetical protein